MTSTYLFLIFAALFLFFLAFSTGAPAFLAPAVLLCLVLMYASFSVRFVRRRLRLSCTLSRNRISRGETADVTIMVSHPPLVPVSSIRLEIGLDEDLPAQRVKIGLRTRQEKIQLAFPTRHAGCRTPSVRVCEITDLFSIRTCRFVPPLRAEDLLVLPVAFDVDSLVYAQIDAGLGTMARATEDFTSPADIRSYQPGDPMKRIHWKLSARKQELLVRHFDEPVLPDALVIMDCEKPRGPHVLDLQDALLETALSVLHKEMARDHMIRMPLMGRYPTEIDGHMRQSLAAEHLARLVWREERPTDGAYSSSFEEVLLMESQRMRRVGATVIISASLTGDMVEIMQQMRRMGPTLRLYLITLDPEDPDILPFVMNLQQAGCEVCYVTPSFG